MCAQRGSWCGGYLDDSGHKVIGSGGAPQDMSAGDRGCDCRSCRPTSCLCVGCGNDTQNEDYEHDPWQGHRFGCPVVYRDSSCHFSTKSGCDDGWGDRWWRLRLSEWPWVRWRGPYQSGEWSYGGSAQPHCGT